MIFLQYNIYMVGWLDNLIGELNVYRYGNI